MMYPDDRRWPFIALDPEFSRQKTWRPENLSDLARCRCSLLTVAR
jgi:hypothetical protein